ncbi:hypothetical protein V1525DRAFT_16183 [Lipomyces kononenkoae]|uniref:Uncharacterized protein n=1 Tax=Lipomyces kononenkoae TaxID=34357 RepID=A0ACC3T846_LIPKO
MTGVQSTAVDRVELLHDSQHSQNRKRKRQHKHKNKRQKQHDTDEKSHSPVYNFNDNRVPEKAAEPDFHVVANREALSESICTEIVQEDGEIDKHTDLDRTNNLLDTRNHISRSNMDDHYGKRISNDQTTDDAEWKERESIDELEVIKELDRLDRDLDAQEEELLWAIMKSGSRIT